MMSPVGGQGRYSTLLPFAISEENMSDGTIVDYDVAWFDAMYAH